MIIVTGGAGFIGSALVWKLNQAGIVDILIVDHLRCQEKWKNLRKLKFARVIGVEELMPWLSSGHHDAPELIFHMGACSSTTERDVDFLRRNNVDYSIGLFEYATQHKIPFVYASSAATYGLGENGFGDDPAHISTLRPLNPYGFSKQLFDQWVLTQKKHPPVWVGLKFFNAYGPNEYHKGSQASLVYHAFPQIRDTGSLRLFKSYRQDYAHGEQKRDFVYVKDVVAVMEHLRLRLVGGKSRSSGVKSGIYNLGSGKARSFADLGRAVFKAIGNPTPKLEWIEMPDALKQQYQYFTEADLTNLRLHTGFDGVFSSLEDGISDYVRNYLQKNDAYL